MIADLFAYLVFFTVIASTYALTCLGLNVQWGVTGLFNVGVAGFVAIGAYTSAILTTPASAERTVGLAWPIAAGWVCAALATGAVALGVGLVTLRLRHDYLAIATFGIAVTIQLLATNLVGLTGGPFGIGFIPRDPDPEKRQVYTLADTDLCLVATAEITLGGMYRDKILEELDLPIKCVGLSHCFRTEAGAPGRDTRGLYRVHQFTKVEMFAFTTPCGLRSSRPSTCTRWTSTASPR